MIETPTEEPKKVIHRKEYVMSRILELRKECRKCPAPASKPALLNGFIGGSASQKEGRFAPKHTEKPRP